jgi:predicted nucleic-acid-binding Zn-ribbon protein
MNTKCSHCGEENVYKTEGVSSRGGYGPDLLPALHGFFRSAKFDVIVCANCGLTQFFADETARTRVLSSTRWRKV